MENKDFAVFILTHGRPDDVRTLRTLTQCGYTGRIYFVVDNEDAALSRYVEKFGAERVRVFDKKKMADMVDEGNNFDERRTITHARNACFEIASQLGVTYFIQLDDDYYEFIYKFDDSAGFNPMVQDLDRVFDMFVDFYKATGAMSVAFAQNGDFIGGVDNGKGAYRFSKRKCMNSFVCSTLRPFQFTGSMNEDVNTYTVKGSQGGLFLTIPVIAINQKDTQTQGRGITDMYLRFGTYCKAFTTVMMHPSGVKVSMMNARNKRIHHSINWGITVPMIISEKHKR